MKAKNHLGKSYESFTKDERQFFEDLLLNTKSIHEKTGVRKITVRAFLDRVQFEPFPEETAQPAYEKAIKETIERRSGKKVELLENNPCSKSPQLAVTVTDILLNGICIQKVRFSDGTVKTYDKSRFYLKIGDFKQ